MYKKTLLLLALLHIVFLLYSQSRNEFKDSLAFELTQIFGIDQGIRKDFNLYLKNLKFTSKIDSMNYYRIKSFCKKYGVPNKNLLGKNYNNESVKSALAAVLLHNPHILANNKKELDFWLKFRDKKQLSNNFIITVLDKYYLYKFKKVRYGSQFGMPHISRKNEVNKNRKEIGVPPLADSLFVSQ